MRPQVKSDCTDPGTENSKGDSVCVWFGTRAPVTRLHTSPDPNAFGTTSAQGASLTINNDGNEASVKINLCDAIDRICTAQRSALSLTIVATSSGKAEVDLNGISGRTRAQLEYTTHAVNVSGGPQFSAGGTVQFARPEYTWRGGPTPGGTLSEQRTELSVSAHVIPFRTEATVLMVRAGFTVSNAPGASSTVCNPVTPGTVAPLLCSESADGPPTGQRIAFAGAVVGRRFGFLNLRTEIMHRLSGGNDAVGRTVLSMPVWIPIRADGSAPSLGIRPTWQAGTKPRFALIVGVVNW
jgi:hypothetical protein